MEGTITIQLQLIDLVGRPSLSISLLYGSRPRVAPIRLWFKTRQLQPNPGTNLKLSTQSTLYRVYSEYGASGGKKVL